VLIAKDFSADAVRKGGDFIKQSIGADSGVKVFDTLGVASAVAVLLGGSGVIDDAGSIDSHIAGKAI
jgi:hypothetical protein